MFGRRREQADVCQGLAAEGGKTESGRVAISLALQENLQVKWDITNIRYEHRVPVFCNAKLKMWESLHTYG